MDIQFLLLVRVTIRGSHCLFYRVEWYFLGLHQPLYRGADVSECKIVLFTNTSRWITLSRGDKVGDVYAYDYDGDKDRVRLELFS